MTDESTGFECGRLTITTGAKNPADLFQEAYTTLGAAETMVSLVAGEFVGGTPAEITDVLLGAARLMQVARAAIATASRVYAPGGFL